MRSVAKTWQDATRILASGTSDRRRDTGQFLVQQFIEYLEENQLAETEGFTAADALALDQYSSTLERFRAVFTTVDSALTAQLTPVGGYGPRARVDAPWGLDFWRLYATDSAVTADEGAKPSNPEPLAGWSAYDVRFEWHFRWDYARGPRERGIQAFAAGVCCLGNKNPFGSERYAEWLRDLSKEDFEYVLGSDKMDTYYLMRFFYPAELVAAFDLPEQGDLLTKWVLQSFKTLSEHPPPPPSEDD